MMKPAEEYSALDEPRRAWAEGWWSGIAVGFVIGLSVCVMVWSAMKGGAL